MKKIFLVALLSIVSMTMFAQKGMQGFGVNLNGHNNECFRIGLDIKYQYNISNYGRIEPYVSAAFGDGNDFTLGVNYNQFLSRVNKIRPYFILGLGYGYLAWEDEYYEFTNYSDPIVRSGFGLDCRLSHKLSFQVEISATSNFIFDTFLAPQIKLGLTYNF